MALSLTSSATLCLALEKAVTLGDKHSKIHIPRLYTDLIIATINMSNISGALAQCSLVRRRLSTGLKGNCEVKIGARRLLEYGFKTQRYDDLANATAMAPFIGFCSSGSSTSR